MIEVTMKPASRYLHLKQGSEDSPFGHTLCGLKDPGSFYYQAVEDIDGSPLCPPCWQQRIEAEQWFPIETAPKDVESFLVGEVDGDRVDRAFFLDGELVIIGGKWTPTHWRHLPARPQREEIR